MNRIAEILFTDLRHVLEQVGKDGGLIGPSVYDTAQVLRFAPPVEGVYPALEWLLQQQHPDGGWGDPAVPRARDVPTLAAILALHTCERRIPRYSAIEHGIAFLNRQAERWSGPLPDGIPVAIELILPRLLDQAHEAGMRVETTAYAPIITLGQRRRRMLAQLSPAAGTPPIHSWETWGEVASAAVVDRSGGVGHSPAATAAWLHAAATDDTLADARKASRQYLSRAAAATGLGIPGVVPTVWPINRMEQIFSLYILLTAGLIDHPALRELVQTQVQDLARAMTPHGIGMSDAFASDGDDTAAAIVVLKHAAQQDWLHTLRHFAVNAHYCAYQGELQPSVSVASHALHALALFDKANADLRDYVREQYLPQFGWASDKWNGSRFYTTGHAMTALLAMGATELSTEIQSVFVDTQRPDGGWGTRETTIEETAYVSLSCLEFQRAGLLTAEARAALQRGGAYLAAAYRPLVEDTAMCWLGKEMFRPRRLARLIELVATLATVLNNDSFNKVE